jgi:putative transposase
LPATVSTDQQAMIEFKGSHFERDVILWAVRWYVAYPISYRQLEEMMDEHGVEVDHATLNRWVLKYVPLLEQEFRARKQPVGPSWRMDETYVRVKGTWKYLYRAVDKAGATVDFLLTAKRDRKAALRFLRKAIKWNGTPEKITIDKSGANTARLKATMPNMRRALRSIRSNTSTTSSNRIIGPSSGWCDQCWGSNPSDQPR